MALVRARPGLEDDRNLAPSHLASAEPPQYPAFLVLRFFGWCGKGVSLEFLGKLGFVDDAVDVTQSLASPGDYECGCRGYSEPLRDILAVVHANGHESHPALEAFPEALEHRSHDMTGRAVVVPEGEQSRGILPDLLPEPVVVVTPVLEWHDPLLLGRRRQRLFHLVQGYRPIGGVRDASA